MSMDETIDLEEQYDKIYRYCYFRVHSRETAEDITQETFLRFLESKGYRDRGKALHYLYTIAGNLCVDEYRRRQTEELTEEVAMEDSSDKLLTNMALRDALAEFSVEERELLLLRYVNEVPFAVICSLTGESRFALYRKINKLLKQLREKLREEDFS